jgi:hypothetical protein
VSRFDHDKFDSTESRSAEPFRVADHLSGALIHVEGAKFRLALVQAALSKAEAAAGREGRPTRDLRVLCAEIDVLKELLCEKERDVIQRIAIEEAKSLG